MTKALTTAEFNSFVRSDKIQTRMLEIFGRDAAANTANIIAMYNQNTQLQKCDANSILSAAVQAAILKLPLNSQLGYAYVVPYYTKGKLLAQLQIGYKGFIQLAIRSGQYITINTNPVCEGEIDGIDTITGELIRGNKISDKIVGYVAFFKLVNHFEKTLYMTREQIEAHASKFSDSFKSGNSNSVWKTNFDDMACKTVLKRLLSKYGVISVDLQQAIAADQSVVSKHSFTYVDNGNASSARDEPDYSPDDSPTDSDAVDPDTGEFFDDNDIPFD